MWLLTNHQNTTRAMSSENSLKLCWYRLSLEALRCSASSNWMFVLRRCFYICAQYAATSDYCAEFVVGGEGVM